MVVMLMRMVITMLMHSLPSRTALIVQLTLKYILYVILVPASGINVGGVQVRSVRFQIFAASARNLQVALEGLTIGFNRVIAIFAPKQVNGNCKKYHKDAGRSFEEHCQSSKRSRGLPSFSRAPHG
mmetsp:Transcript_99890/g.187936  ORF Transcript_99890/g.187936 Transcript_99890/m.187936 type:complete len:126 (+) Transcript_99890:1-378(+)